MTLPVIRHRAGKIIAVVLALAGWVGGGYWFMNGGHLFQAQGWEQRIGWHLSGAAIFFVLAVFLPEERKARSIGRKGALQIMAFAMWLSATELMMHFKDLQRGPEVLALLLGVPVLAYLVCLFMIRGFRAVPEYAVEVEVAAEREIKPGEAGVEKNALPASGEPVAAVADESRVTSLIGSLEGSTAVESKEAGLGVG